MSDATIWWILAGLLVGAELLSGTLYLLMLALGAAAGGLVAHFDGTLNTQLVAAALVGGAAVVLWYLHQQRQRQGDPAAVGLRADAPSPGLGHLDVGEQVIVHTWDADGTTRVQHRGSEWRARLVHPGAHHIGPHRICAIDRNQLIIEPV